MDISKMTKKERIQEFIKRHPDVEQDHMPVVWLWWAVKENGKAYPKYYNTSTGEVFNCGPENSFLNKYGFPNEYNSYNQTPFKQGRGYFRDSPYNWVMLSPSSQTGTAYFKYDDELEVLEFAQITIDTHRYNRKLSQKENIRKWERIEGATRAFYFRGDKTPYDKYGEEITTFYPYEYPATHSFKTFLQNIRRLHFSQKNADEFKRYANGNLYGSCGRPIYGNYLWQIEEFLLAKDKSKGKVGKTIDELVKLPLKPVEEIVKIVPNMSDEYKIANPVYGWQKAHNDSLKDIAYIETIPNSSWDVIRVFFMREGMLDEGYRFYINENGTTVTAQKSSENSWTTTTNLASRYSRSKPTIINIQDMKKVRRLSYIADFISELNEVRKHSRIFSCIMTAIKNPIIEQIYKAGYKRIAFELANSDHTNAEIINMFGEIDMKQSNLFAKLGVNKYQLSKLEQAFSTVSCSSNHIRCHDIGTLKTIRGQRSIAHIGDDIFERDMDTVRFVSNMLNNVVAYFNDEKFLRLFGTWSVETKMNFLNKVSKFNSFVMTRDCFNMFKELPDEYASNFVMPDISSPRDLAKWHDDIMRMYNIRQSEIMDAKNKEKEAKMAKIDTKRKEFETEDEKYSIVLPKKLSEIVVEGKTLGHCVGSYTDSHAIGSTTIMFLRRKDAPNTPFYTIEVRNYKEKPYIAQIHGYRNKWLGCNPEVVPFVMRWLRDKLIRCEDRILLSTSTHYGSTGYDLIPKPQI